MKFLEQLSSLQGQSDSDTGALKKRAVIELLKFSRGTYWMWAHKRRRALIRIFVEFKIAL